MAFVFRCCASLGILYLLVLGSLRLEAFPRLVAKEEYLYVIGQEKVLSWEYLFDLSLGVSGVGVEKRGAYRAKLDMYIDDLTRLLEPLGGDYEKGEEMLRYIYRFLTGYEALQTRMDVMFQSGSYNCVSSAILYVSLARAFGFEATGVGTYDHAFVNLVLADDRNIDVETTSKYGFDPGQKKEFIDTFISMTGLVYVPPKKYAKRKSLSDAKFISLVLQNRLHILNQNNQNFRVLEQMIPLAADLATLTQADRDIQNFFSMVSQYSFNLSQTGNVEQALRFIDLTLEAYGERESILVVRNAISYNDVFTLIENKKYNEAEERLASYRSSNTIDLDSYRKLRHRFKSKQLEELVNSSTVPFDKKLAVVQGIVKDDVLSLRNQEELYQVVYGNEVYSLLINGKFRKAVQLLENYPVVLRNRSFYLKIQTNIENAHVVHIYNKSVAEINKEAYQEAEQSLAKGLSFYPDNMRLLQLHSSLLQLQSGVS